MDKSKGELLARLRGLMGSMSNKMGALEPVDPSDLELTMAQRKTLVFLRQGTKHMSELAAHLGTTTSSATSMIDRLVNKQLVERVDDAADRRIVSCRLTESGREEVNRFWATASKHFEHIADILDRDELAVIVRGLEILIAAAERQTLSTSDSGNTFSPEKK